MGGAQDRRTRLLGLILSVLLAVTLLPAAGIQSAFADDPVERPETAGGDVALESASGSASGDDATQVPVAQQREDGMQVAGGLVYTVADGGLALVGFDLAEGADAKSLAVPATIVVDGKDTSVVAVDIAEGNVAEGVTALTLPQSLRSIDVASLAPAFPGLISVEVTSGEGSSLPVAAGAEALRATYSSFGGALLGRATVDAEGEGGSVESVQCRELLWAPPAMVVARVPVDCLSIAPGALADASGLETIVCFGDVQRIAAAERDDAGSVTVPGALTDDQLASVTVVFPDATPAVPSEGDGRVSASMALNDGATQTDKRHAWIALGLPLERLSMGKPVGALTETVAVTEEGAPASDEAQLISYPGMHPKATDVKHPGEDGTIDMAESGLAYTMKSDMTLSVRWEGDITATPAHLEIPACVAIDGVTYPVTEIAPGAFKSAAFLTRVTFPETLASIGNAAFKGSGLESIDIPNSDCSVGVDAFADCTGLAETLPRSTNTSISVTMNDNHTTANGDDGLEAYDTGDSRSCIVACGPGISQILWRSVYDSYGNSSQNWNSTWHAANGYCSGREGYSVSVTAVDCPGYRVTGYRWETASGRWLSSSNSCTTPGENFKLTISTEIVKVNLEYDANGGSGSLPSSVVGNAGSTTLISECDLTPPADSDREFARWNTAADGSGIWYAPGATFRYPTTGVTSVTLYAIWGMRYSVLYNPMGGSGSPPSTGSTNVYRDGFVLPECTFAAPDAAHFFGAWYTDEKCEGLQWLPGQEFTPEDTESASVTFYAKWIPKVINVSIQLEGASSQTVFWGKEAEGYTGGSGGTATDANSTGLTVKFKNTGNGVNYAAKLAQIKVYDAGASSLFDLAPDGTGPEVFTLSDGAKVQRFGFREGAGAYTVDVGEGFVVPIGDTEVAFTLGCDFSEDDIKPIGDMGSTPSVYTAPLVKVVYVFEPTDL